MPMVVGPVKAKINGKFAITVENFSWDYTIPTKQHFGGYGYYGTSQGQNGVSGSFKFAFPATGAEFDFTKEFAGSMGTIQLADKGIKIGFENVALAGGGGSIDQVQGATEGTIKWSGIQVAL